MGLMPRNMAVHSQPCDSQHAGSCQKKGLGFLSITAP